MANIERRKPLATIFAIIWKILKFIAFAFKTLVITAAAFVAVGVFFIVDREDVCRGYYEKFGHTWGLSCDYAPEEQAKQAIQLYYARAAGSNSFNGWERLSENLQSRWPYESFRTQWKDIAYSEIISISKSHQKEYNTYLVEYRLYRVDEEGDDFGGTNTFQGEIDEFTSRVRVKKHATNWMIDGIVSVEKRLSVRQPVRFARAEDENGTSTREWPAENSPLQYTPGIKNGRLPVYCVITEPASDTALWVRTSLGWLGGNEVSVIPHLKDDSGRIVFTIPVRECEKENTKLIIDSINNID